MPTASVNGVKIFYEVTGSEGVPLVLVHGAWFSHRGWHLVVPGLAESCRVVAYDRRGHSASERPPGQGSVRDDVGDLAGLIEHLDLAPAWVAGVSAGGAIILRLVAERPDLVRGAVVHEPGVFALLADDPEAAPLLGVVRERIGAVVERIVSGDHAGAAKQFVETIAAGPGRWAELSPEFRRILTENAPSFVDDVNDPEALEFDLAWLEGFTKPTLLTVGEHSPPFFTTLVSQLAAALPGARVHTFSGAGHVPHRTDPEAYIEAVTGFIRQNSPGSKQPADGASELEPEG